MLHWLTYWDAGLVHLLQRLLSPLPHLHTITTSLTLLGDPRYSYLVIFPLVFWTLGDVAGGHVISIAALTEWINIILKW